MLTSTWTPEMLAGEIKITLSMDKDFVIAVSGGTGCQPAGSKVLMANGEWKNIEQVRKGDLVLSPQQDGSHIYAKVLDTTRWFSNENYDVYELNRQKNRLYSCSHNHLIPFNQAFYPKKNGKRPPELKVYRIKHYTASDFYKLNSKNQGHKSTTLSSFAIPQFKDRVNCEIEPYTLGIFLGDGCFRNRNLRLTLNGGDSAVASEISSHYEIINVYQKKGAFAKDYSFSVKGELSDQLSKYGLEGKGSGTKFIPKEALFSDMGYRKKLLAGLVDSDGYYCNGGYALTTKSERLAKDILDLVYSLGGRGRIRAITKGIKSLNFIGQYYRVSFYLGKLKLPLLTQRRKDNLSKVYLSSNRTAIKLEKSKPCEVFGFELESESGWYITDNWMITHNSGKSVCAYQIAKALDPEFDMARQMIFSRNDLIEAINTLPKFKPVVVDEAVMLLFRRDWANAEQKGLLKILDICRYKNLVLIFCIPNFWSLDSHVLHRIRTRIHVDRRGLGYIFNPSENPFVRDKWCQKDNAVLVGNWEDHNTVYKARGFVGSLHFRDMPQSVKEVYTRIKADKQLLRDQEEEVSNAKKVKDVRFNRVKKYVESRGLLPVGKIDMVAAGLEEDDDSEEDKEE